MLPKWVLVLFLIFMGVTPLYAESVYLPMKVHAYQPGLPVLVEDSDGHIYPANKRNPNISLKEGDLVNVWMDIRKVGRKTFYVEDMEVVDVLLNQ